MCLHVREPHPSQKFNDTALQTQGFVKNTRQNNLRFLHGTVTYILLLPFTVTRWQQWKAILRDENI